MKKALENSKPKPKKNGLKGMSFQAEEKKIIALKRQVQRDRITIRAFFNAAIDLYLRGGFNVEKQSNQVDEK